MVGALLRAGTDRPEVVARDWSLAQSSSSVRKLDRPLLLLLLAQSRSERQVSNEAGIFAR